MPPFIATHCGGLREADVAAAFNLHLDPEQPA
jgi:hypothetical protein